MQPQDWFTSLDCAVLIFLPPSPEIPRAFEGMHSKAEIFGLSSNGYFCRAPILSIFCVCVCSPNQGAGLLGTQYSTRSHGELSNIEAGHTIHRHEVRFTLYFCQTRQPNFWQMMLTNMLCVLPASAEDARIDDGSHKSNSPKNAEATGISDTPQMDLVRGTHVEMRKSFLMKGSSRTGWQAEMLTFFQQLPDKFLCERYIWLPY